MAKKDRCEACGYPVGRHELNCPLGPRVGKKSYEPDPKPSKKGKSK